jgi:phosphohistidine phosphatase SixA
MEWEVKRVIDGVGAWVVLAHLPNENRYKHLFYGRAQCPDELSAYTTALVDLKKEKPHVPNT